MEQLHHPTIYMDANNICHTSHSECNFRYVSLNFKSLASLASLKYSIYIAYYLIFFSARASGARICISINKYVFIHEAFQIARNLAAFFIFHILISAGECKIGLSYHLVSVKISYLHPPYVSWCLIELDVCIDGQYGKLYINNDATANRYKTG